MRVLSILKSILNNTLPNCRFFPVGYRHRFLEFAAAIRYHVQAEVMRLCVEGYFLINQAMDFSIIAVVTRRLGCFRLRRALICATLGAMYASLTLLHPGLGLPLAQFMLLWPMALLATGRPAWKRAASAGLTMAVLLLATGACALRMASGHFTPASLLLPGLLSNGLIPDCHASESYSTMVEVQHNRETVRFSACVDTGNRLTEPLSGQPVMVACEKLLRGILPDTGYRQVAYGSIGGSGVMRCFRPDRIYIWDNGRRRRAPEAWIAIYPDRLPGTAQALTPAAFARL